jgi:dihydrofolate reductase|uniref:dihydrofolate reductase n=1 Tax=Ackermannviridae sp. TaxID=2831612 RepID=A0A8S5VTG7_9CAUD|nr:MAG TPA: Dihydrofolate reductase [Ackermannviridae sp.]
MKVKFIASVDKNFAVGNDGKLLFRIREDMNLFREMTMGNIVIMGRKTYEEIGKPLEGRLNIVLSRDDISIEGVHVFKSMEMLKAFCESSENRQKDVFVIGGAEMWNLFRRYVSQIHLTKVPDDCHEYDTVFPYDLLTAFTLVHRNQIGFYEKNYQPIVHEVYDRLGDVVVMNRKSEELLVARFVDVLEYVGKNPPAILGDDTVKIVANDRIAVRTDLRVYELPLGTLVSVDVVPSMFMNNGLMIAGWDIVDDDFIVYMTLIGKKSLSLKRGDIIADVNFYSRHPLMYAP